MNILQNRRNLNNINPKLLKQFIRVSERAAFGASKYRGKNVIYWQVDPLTPQIEKK